MFICRVATQTCLHVVIFAFVQRCVKKYNFSYWNLKVKCDSFFFFYLFIYLMNVINSPFVPLHVETMPSIYLKYSRELCLCVSSSIAFGLKICHKGITLLIWELCLLIQNGIHKRYAMPAASVVVWRLWSFKMFIWSELRW